MVTKTVTLELDVYERLKRAKRSPRESFSSVVRRAVWHEESLTAGALLARMTKAMHSRVGVTTEDVLDRLDAAQEPARVSDSKR